MLIPVYLAELFRFRPFLATLKPPPMLLSGLIRLFYASVVMVLIDERTLDLLAFTLVVTMVVGLC